MRKCWRDVASPWPRLERSIYAASRCIVADCSGLSRAFPTNRIVKRHECRAPAAWRGRSSNAFTLIEIMVVVIIIGVLAATIIPQFIGTTHDAKVSAAKGHIAELESALERFNVHMDRYPSTEEGLKVLVEAPAGEEKKWRGPYIKMLRADPWGGPYQYRFPGTHHTSSYDLWSRVADGADGGEGNNADIGNWH